MEDCNVTILPCGAQAKGAQEWWKGECNVTLLLSGSQTQGLKRRGGVTLYSLLSGLKEREQKSG